MNRDEARWYRALVATFKEKPPQVVAMIAMYEAGMSCNMIAKHFGYKHGSAVVKRLNNHGVKLRTAREASLQRYARARHPSPSST